MKLRSVIVACASFLSIVTLPAYSESRADAFTFTLGGGTMHFASSRNMKNTGVGFLGLGYDFTDHWGIEALLGGFNTHFNSSEMDDRSISGTLFTIDGLYHFTPPTYRYLNYVEPYVLAGVGVLGMNPNGTNAHNEGNINAGLGLAFFIHPSIAFRVEARDFYTIVGGKNDYMIDGGITFLLGGCPTNTPVGYVK